MNDMHISPNYISKKYAIQNYQIWPQYTKNDIVCVRGCGGGGWGGGGAAFFLGKGEAGPALPVFCIHNLRKMAQGINEWMKLYSMSGLMRLDLYQKYAS